MARSNAMIFIVVLLTLCIADQLDASVINRLFSIEDHKMVKRSTTTEAEYTQRFQLAGSLPFNYTVVAEARERRKFACLFVFDKEASADLNDSLIYADRYATQLAALASKYTAHANIVIINAGVEIWSNGDQISFAIGSDPTSAMSDFLTQFQKHLDKNKAFFEKTYAIGVLISNKPTFVAGGYSQGPPCTTFGASLINYRPYPLSIAGLLAHELAHTLSVVHPFELSYMCQAYPTLTFCTSSTLPAECTCDSNAYPPELCLMTYQFGRATIRAPTYTPCDIAMMNRFSSNIACLIK